MPIVVAYLSSDKPKLPATDVSGFPVESTQIEVFLTETDIREEDDDGDDVAFGVPLATSPTGPSCSARSSADGGERCCCCLLESGSGIAHITFREL